MNDSRILKFFSEYGSFHMLNPLGFQEFLRFFVFAGDLQNVKMQECFATKISQMNMALNNAALPVDGVLQFSV